MVGILLIIASLPLFVFPSQFKNAPVKAAAIKQKMKQSGGNFFVHQNEESHLI